MILRPTQELLTAKTLQSTRDQRLLHSNPSKKPIKKNQKPSNGCPLTCAQLWREELDSIILLGSEEATQKAQMASWDRKSLGENTQKRTNKRSMTPELNELHLYRAPCLPCLTVYSKLRLRKLGSGWVRGEE